MTSRRQFLAKTATLAAGISTTSGIVVAADKNLKACISEISSLCGEWLFSTDADDSGTKHRWFESSFAASNWIRVTVPHTWQVDPRFAEHRGVAWYRRSFDVPSSWGEAAVRIEFEGVFHTATVWVNGQLAGEHVRKGYTAFTIEISRFLKPGEPNAIVIRVNNAFDEHMLPRGRSSDWAHDGGIFRPVQLMVTPKSFVEQIQIDASPELASGEAKLAIVALCRNTGSRPWKGLASFRVTDENSGQQALANPNAGQVAIAPGVTQTVAVQATLANAKLWHFDRPNLYRLEFSVAGENESHQLATTFGVRKFAIQNGQFYLNGEHVRLMGVERMAGSNPAFGMAEPPSWITHDHDDLKNLNCIFSRVHWPQDKRVLDYCDRHGILMQSEIPAWGWETFGGMTAEPDADIVQNGLEQLREMIARDRNHPSVVVWGLCNEIGGQNPPAYQFAKRMLEEAKKLDPHRLCSYASNSLAENPGRDVAGLMDFIETNEYFGSWAAGDAESAAKHFDELHAAFPGKPIVISEYGYCACTPERPEGDKERIDILRSHDKAIRSKEFVGGAIFFCYNDYRTHVGDRGVGALMQRVHGVVDVYGNQKASYAVLREEASPVESLTIENVLNRFRIRIRTRDTVPMHTLKEYRLRGVFYGQGEIPTEEREAGIPEIAPGSEVQVELAFTQSGAPVCIKFDVLRPTGFPALSILWKPPSPR
jgi:beta-galactosidase